MIRPGFAQYLAQALHDHVDRASVDVRIVAPHLNQELRTVEGSADIQHKKLQQPVFDASELQDPAAHRDAVRGGVQLQ